MALKSRDGTNETRIDHVGERSDGLFGEMFTVWEASVRATHTFLREADIKRIAGHVPDTFREVESLIVARNDDGDLLGFCGVSGQEIEMLFMAPSARGRGIGKRLLRTAVEDFGARTLDVNEQNTPARGFYEHEGFEVVGRSETDSMGDPFPILHMKLPSA